MYYLSIKQPSEIYIVITQEEKWNLGCLNTSSNSHNFRFLGMNLNPDLPYFKASVLISGAKMSSEINF